MRNLLFAAAAIGLAATPAVAQVDVSQGLVAVTIDDVSILNNFLNNDQISALNGNAVTVQVPVGVAATVCGINASVLAKSKAGGAVCTAKSGSQALAKSVIDQKITMKK